MRCNAAMPAGLRIFYGRTFGASAKKSCRRDSLRRATNEVRPTTLDACLARVHVAGNVCNWRRAFVASNQERVTNGTMARSSARRSIKRKRPAGITPPTLSCDCRLAGPVPLLCIPSCWIDLIGSAERRLTPLHAGMVRPYRGRLPLRNWNGAGYPLV